MNIEKAHESLQAADLCLQNMMYNSTVNRAYYAMFQAAIVALEQIGVKPKGEQWSHEGVQATFAIELTRRRKIFPKSMVNDLLNVLAIRNKGDYQTDSVTNREAGRTLLFARNFVEAVFNGSFHG